MTRYDLCVWKREDATHGNREIKGAFVPKKKRSMGGVLQQKPVFYHCWAQNCVEWKELDNSISAVKS